MTLNNKMPNLKSLKTSLTGVLREPQDDRGKNAAGAKLSKNMYEFAAWEAGRLVVGLDEVGRGCLAGPLVTAAVMLPLGKAHRQLKDSKVMDADERATAYRWIVKNCHFGVGIVHHRIIDEHNIWQANLIAMQKALLNLLATTPIRPSAILSDAVPLKLTDTAFANIPFHSFPKGERYSSSIAAASIVAKVTRDAMMEKLDLVFPGYKLGQHKGYCTAVHQTAVRELGPSIIHRMSFLKNLLHEDTMEIQGSLFSTIKTLNLGETL